MCVRVRVRVRVCVSCVSFVSLRVHSDAATEEVAAGLNARAVLGAVDKRLIQ